MKVLVILWFILAIIADFSIKDLNLLFWISFPLFIVLSFYIAYKMDKKNAYGK